MTDTHQAAEDAEFAALRSDLVNALGALNRILEFKRDSKVPDSMAPSDEFVGGIMDWVSSKLKAGGEKIDTWSKNREAKRNRKKAAEADFKASEKEREAEALKEVAAEKRALGHLIGPPRKIAGVPDTFCAACGKADPAFQCSKCGSEFYCSEECQRAHFPAHRHLCALLMSPYRDAFIGGMREWWRKRADRLSKSYAKYKDQISANLKNSIDANSVANLLRFAR